MWFGRPRGRDPAAAELASSAVIARCHFCRAKCVQVCVQLTWSSFLASQSCHLVIPRLLMGQHGGSMPQVWPGVRARQCAQAKTERPESALSSGLSGLIQSCSVPGL